MPRSSILLNGPWDFAPLTDINPPTLLPAGSAWLEQPVQVPSSWRWSFNPSAEFQPYDLFGYPVEWNNYEAGLLRRTFFYTQRAGEHAWLVFEGIMQRAVIFLNGQKVAESTESYLPLEVDITEQVRVGENELVVWCGPYERISTPVGSKVIAPCGSWFASLALGIWQDVRLETRPQVWITEIAVRTSTRAEEIEVEAWVENRSGLPFVGDIQARVEAEAHIALELRGLPVTLAPRERRGFTFHQTWQGARRWSPQDPFLYHLHCELAGGEQGRDSDQAQVRFGFREVWFEGHKLMLNGVRVNLRGDAWHYQGFAMQTKEYALNWYRLCRETGINFVRLHAMPYPSFFLDAADETGMLIVDESAIYGSGKAMQADHPQFIENCQTHLQALVRRDRNHPSVIVWSMQNEMRWVDGRDGYLQAIPALTGAMKALDSTRAISYDGDNRLVPEELCEIVSMHYNIDGTVAGWDQQKPLIFGEHGAFHYVSPQVSSRFGGPQTYRKFAPAMEAIAYQERLFIEYARRAEVTGQTPFNTVNYTMWALSEPWNAPERPTSLAPGPNPKQIPAYALTVNNGLLPASPVFQPAPAWQQLAAGFRPVTIIADEYDAAFFGGQRLVRHFSIYNDQMIPADVRLVVQWKLAGQAMPEKQVSFKHLPGERTSWQAEFDLPDEFADLKVSVGLYHGDALMEQRTWDYTVFPTRLKNTPIQTAQNMIYLGSGLGLSVVQKLLPGIRVANVLSELVLEGVQVIIIGDRQTSRVEKIQPLLNRFAEQGGSILVLEQEQLTLGDLSLADRTFAMAWVVDGQHPLLNDLKESDLRFWQGENPTGPNARGISLGAFNKPAGGDVRILLECGDGDFGWGGLLWTPLVEYRVGKGRVVLNQMDVCRSFNSVPAACILLRNLLSYIAKPVGAPELAPPRVLAAPSVVKVLDALGIKPVIGSGELSIDSTEETQPAVWLVDPASLTVEEAGQIRVALERGGIAFVLPIQPEHVEMVSHMVGQPVQTIHRPVYQLINSGHEFVCGISDVDLFHLERVTYTPASHANRVVCQDALKLQGAEDLFVSAQNPWEAFFMDGKDGEWQKIAIATMLEHQPQDCQVYGAVLPVGLGRVIFCQVLPEAGNEKVQRIYSRLLANLGVEIDTPLLTVVRPKKDYAIESWMSLLKEPYQDATAVEAYFRDPGYTLNNLGEGVYGWMKRMERREGAINIPNSAGRTCFLSVFVESEINRDPTRRAAHELPDSSIVPDLFLEINCAYRLYVNGRLVSQGAGDAQGGVIKVEDVVLSQGINRLILVCEGGAVDSRFNAWFLNKYGDSPAGLHYRLTLD